MDGAASVSAKTQRRPRLKKKTKNEKISKYSRVKHETMLSLFSVCVEFQRNVHHKPQQKKSETEYGIDVSCAGSVPTNQHDVFHVGRKHHVDFLFSPEFSQ